MVPNQDADLCPAICLVSHDPKAYHTPAGITAGRCTQCILHSFQAAKKNSLQPKNNFFPRSLLSFAFLGWWLRLDIFRLGSIGCRCSFISFAVLALSGVAVLDVLVNLTFQHFVDVLLGHDFHAPGCRLRQKYFYGRSCHKKIL